MTKIPVGVYRKPYEVFMFKELKPRLDEAKKDWLSHTEEIKEKGPKEVFFKYIFEKYFNEESRKNPNKCFLWWNTYLVGRIWRREEQEEEEKEKLKGLSDADVEKMMTENRRLTIFLLNKILKKYHEDGETKVDLEKIIRLYDRLQAAEEAAKRTDLLKKKEARESVVDYFNLAAQYGELSDDDINKLFSSLKDAKKIRQIQNSPQR